MHLHEGFRPNHDTYECPLDHLFHVLETSIGEKATLSNFSAVDEYITLPLEIASAYSSIYRPALDSVKDSMQD
jgi:hypothetical protein